MTHVAKSAARHERVSALFLEACELPADQREAFLRQRCNGDNPHDRDLLPEVLELLAHDTAAAAIDRPVMNLAASAPALLQERSLSHSPMPARLGDYEILGVLGEGGMGTVYRARQQNPDRLVALKVIRPGLASREIIRRFEMEARLLGRLQHPGIAQVYEAGTADTGRGGPPQPYFAMELVEGRPLLAFTREAELSVRQRLELLAKICDAVQHAHQKGIVHRDLKPGNILVTNDPAADGLKPVCRDAMPKILDFGVARTIDPGFQNATLQTDVGQLVGTLAYMSPEQVAGDPREVDVRSDVYALGVIAYELLSGRLPHDVRGKTIVEAAQTIQSGSATRLSAVNRAWRGDIETIISKAMEKDKARRYQAASDLAEDIRRYLRDEPIMARPPSALYQMRKFARRNRALVSAVALGVAALLAATVVSMAFAIRAHQAANRETRQREVAERISGYLQRMLTSADPHADGEELTLVGMLDQTVARLDREQEIPEIEAELRTAIGGTYLRLRQPQRAIVQLERAVDLWRNIDPRSARLALTLLPLGVARLHVGDAAASEAAYREAIPILDHLRLPDAVSARGALLDMLIRAQRFEEAAPIARAMLEQTDPEDAVMMISRLRQLAKIEAGLGEHELADQRLAAARELVESRMPANHPMQIGVRLDLAVLRKKRGDLAGTLEATRAAFELAEAIAKPGSHDWKTCLSAHVETLHAMGRWDEMREVLARARAALVAAHGEDNPLVSEFDAGAARAAEE